MGPEHGVALVLGTALVLYTLTGGADFGGGLWDLLARGPRQIQQRRAIALAIGPIWEANHVWLILALVLTFVCFPLAFAAISTALHIPLVILLIGIVARGAAFVFRAYKVAAVFLKLGNIALSGRVEPHFAIHGWGDQHFCFGGKVNAG